jgi:hypothetical protein
MPADEALEPPSDWGYEKKGVGREEPGTQGRISRKRHHDVSLVPFAAERRLPWLTQKSVKALFARPLIWTS